GARYCVPASRERGAAGAPGRVFLVVLWDPRPRRGGGAGNRSRRHTAATETRVQSSIGVVASQGKRHSVAGCRRASDDDFVVELDRNGVAAVSTAGKIGSHFPAGAKTSVGTATQIQPDHGKLTP